MRSVRLLNSYTIVTGADDDSTTDKVRLLYDRSQSTARIVVRNQDDLKTPLVRLLSSCPQTRSLHTHRT
jgi:hypothetical protein